jgi:hypothetical protein
VCEAYGYIEPFPEVAIAAQFYGYPLFIGGGVGAQVYNHILTVSVKDSYEFGWGGGGFLEVQAAKDALAGIGDIILDEGG